MLRFTPHDALARLSQHAETMKHSKRALGRPERAVFDLIHTNALPLHALLALYRREISALVSAGLVSRDATGLRIVGAVPAPPSVPPPAQPPPREILENLNVRVPHAVHEGLELVAGNGAKSDVVRAIIAHALPALVRAKHAGRIIDRENVIDILRDSSGSGERATGT